MLQAVLVWSGAVLAISLLLVMALGPVIVEVDSWWYERRHNRRRRRAARAAARREPAGRVEDRAPQAREADAQLV